MESLQKTIYKTLPRGIKMEIINNPDKYPEYQEVIKKLNTEILKEKATKIKDKLKLTKNNLALMSVLISIYYHIKSNPPEYFKDSKFKGLHAFNEFSYIISPLYQEQIEYTDLWPKYMYLIYYTYKISYQKWYNIRNFRNLDNIIIDNILKFNRKKDKLIDYIYKTYHHLDKNITLEQFRDAGY